MDNDMISELLDDGSFYGMYVDCPECYFIEDDQYTCLTCDSQGGVGKISINRIVGCLLKGGE